MIRKLTTIAVATLVAFAVLPVMAASAAVSGTAQITAAKEGFPGVRDLSIRVNNTQATFPLPGGSVNWVEIVLPAGFSQAECPAPTVGTWSCQVVNVPLGGQTVQYTGGPIAPGGNFTFPLRAQANRPASSDVTARFRAYLSEDFGQTTNAEASPTTPGALDAVVRILELVPSGMRATAPAGVVDQNGTAQQTGLTYQAVVKNHARNAVPVTLTMSSSGNDVFTAPQTLSAAGNSANTTYSFGLDLGTAAGQSQARTFRAAATAPGATAQDATQIFTVEAAPLLTLQSSSFSHPIISSDDALTYTFTINANKLNLPGLTGLSGFLEFACHTDARRIDLSGPASIARNPQNGVVLTFGPFQICAAPDGVYDAHFAFQGVDDNGKDYAQTVDVSDLIEIDNLAPIVELLDIAAPSGQEQVKDSDQITVRGSVNDTVQRAPLAYVELQSTNGARIPVTVTTTTTGSGYTFTGSATLADIGDYGQITAVAEACDRAFTPNCGGDASNSLDIDNVLPELNDPGRVVRDAVYGPNPVIEVRFNDQFTARAGCDVTHWTVSGTSENAPRYFVREVRLSNGEICTRALRPANAPAITAWPTDNIRILTVTTGAGGPIALDETPQVRYMAQSTPLAVEDAATDGALNEALDKTVATIWAIAPAAPNLVDVLRNNGAEDATFDEDVYWTRFPGNDAIVEYGGFRTGYFVQVVDGAGNVLRTEEADGTVVVPIGSSDGLYYREIRLINTAGLIGDGTPVPIMLDRQAASLTGATYDGASTVTATWSEKLWSGSNFLRVWFVHERNEDFEPGSGDSPYHNYRPTAVNGTQSAARQLTVELGNLGPFAGVTYAFDGSQGTEVYVDRAGNATPNQSNAS